MKILILKTGEIIERSYSQALRKIEQGLAVPVVDSANKNARAEPEAGDA